MDIDATLHQLLNEFVKNIASSCPQTRDNIIHEMKWQILCAFVASQNIDNIQTSLIPLSLEAKQ